MAEHLSINCGGTLVTFDRPHLMGILNVTPDSFYDGGQYANPATILSKAEEMIAEGATFIDVGGMSSRPGAEVVPLAEELKRAVSTVKLLKKTFPDVLISIDTVRAEVARQAAQAGATLINDISAGCMDEKMFPTVADLKLPYVLMHMQGTPATMQQSPTYKNVTLSVMDFFIEKLGELRRLQVTDVILDPGFGFGKTVSHNYTLLQKLSVFHTLDCPLLVGMSRKSMFCKLLKISPSQALNATTAGHVMALLGGAHILRVHDVKEAMQAIQVVQATQKS